MAKLPARVDLPQGGQQRDVLLATKFQIPLPLPNTVIRTRLLGKLEEALNCKFTLVSAPAGFGKTTLLGEWSRLGRRPTAWLSIDESDNDPRRFWTYFISALQRLEAGIGDSALNLLRLPEPVPMERVLTTLINQLATLPKGRRDRSSFVFVMDDYHLIEARSIHDDLAYFIEHSPPQLHLVISTRADPSLPLARMRGRGDLAELRVADLRFTRDESTRLFNDLLGLGLGSEDIAALDSRTEGWIAGLRMAALSLQGNQDVQGFIQSFTGSNRYIFDYLIEEVFQRQPEEIQAFLLQTSILDRLCSPLCDAVIESKESREESSGYSPFTSQSILKYLEHSNLFLVPMDEAREWFRYHHLFAALLRHRLKMVTNPEQMSGLRRRASCWYETNGFLEESIHHALAAADWERAIGLIHAVNETMLKRGEIATLLKWYGSLPEDEVLARPQLCFDYSWPLILSGQLDLAESYIARAKKAAGDNSFLDGSIKVAEAYIARVRGDDQRTIELSQQALSLLPPDNPLPRSVVAMNLGVAHWNKGQLSEAEQALREAERAARLSGNIYSRVTALNYLGRIQVVRGMLHTAARYFRRAIRAGNHLPSAAGAYIELSALYYEWNDLRRAEENLEKGIELSRQSANVEILLQAYRIQARIRGAQGNHMEALAILEQANQIAQDRQVTQSLRAATAAGRIHVALAQRDLNAASRWVDQVPIGDEATPFSMLSGLVIARLLIAQGKHQAAMAAMVDWYQKAQRMGWQVVVVIIRALQAMAESEHGARMAFLVEALELAEPEGFIRAFVDLGEGLRGLLTEWKERIERLPGSEIDDRQLKLLLYCSRILEAFSPETPIQGTSERVRGYLSGIIPLVEPVSEREMDVLELLAKGLTYQEIANSLFISVNTVKTHLKNVYGKLGAKDRREAVKKARHLGLVS